MKYVIVIFLSLFVALVFSDMFLSWYALENYDVIEVNPVLSSLFHGKFVYGLVLVFLGSVTLIGYLIFVLCKQCHELAALLISLVCFVVILYIHISNWLLILNWSEM